MRFYLVLPALRINIIYKKMKDKYLSIITNFGCHYKCPYCIVKNNNLQIPVTTIDGLKELRKTIIDNNINIISLSGGGDPCYNFENNRKWYAKLFEIATELNIPIELHTTYINVQNFPYNMFDRIVYHCIDYKQIQQIKKHNNEKIRVVFVVTELFTEDLVNEITVIINKQKEPFELTFRQMVNSEYKNTYYLYDFLKKWHAKRWWYVEQNDYNLYYAENNISYKYEDFKQK